MDSKSTFQDDLTGGGTGPTERSHLLGDASSDCDEDADSDYEELTREFSLNVVVGDSIPAAHHISEFPQLDPAFVTRRPITTGGVAAQLRQAALSAVARTDPLVDDVPSEEAEDVQEIGSQAFELTEHWATCDMTPGLILALVVFGILLIVLVVSLPVGIVLIIVGVVLYRKPVYSEVRVERALDGRSFVRFAKRLPLFPCGCCFFGGSERYDTEDIFLFRRKDYPATATCTLELLVVGDSRIPDDRRSVEWDQKVPIDGRRDLAVSKIAAFLNYGLLTRDDRIRRAFVAFEAEAKKVLDERRFDYVLANVIIPENEEENESAERREALEIRFAEFRSKEHSDLIRTLTPEVEVSSGILDSSNSEDSVRKGVLQSSYVVLHPDNCEHFFLYLCETTDTKKEELSTLVGRDFCEQFLRKLGRKYLREGGYFQQRWQAVFQAHPVWTRRWEVILSVFELQDEIEVEEEEEEEGEQEGPIVEVGEVGEGQRERTRRQVIRIVDIDPNSDACVEAIDWWRSEDGSAEWKRHFPIQSQRFLVQERLRERIKEYGDFTQTDEIRRNLFFIFEYCQIEDEFYDPVARYFHDLSCLHLDGMQILQSLSEDEMEGRLIRADPGEGGAVNEGRNAWIARKKLQEYVSLYEQEHQKFGGGGVSQSVTPTAAPLTNVTKQDTICSKIGKYLAGKVDVLATTAIEEVEKQAIDKAID